MKPIKKLFLAMSVGGILSYPHFVSAAAFQLWEQDGASVGNYHAGRAAIAEDASTAYYNPAGLVRIPNQQVVLGVVPITIDFLFDGTVALDKMDDNEPHSAVSQGGSLSFVPDLHYSAPLLENLVFGLSVVAPFGLKTDYNDQTFTRYSATTTSLQVVDIAPSLGFAITSKLSVGFGADIEYSRATFNLVAGLFDPMLDTKADNSLSGNGVGYHLGILYQFTPYTRLGLAYQSKVTHDFTGTSKFEGMLANVEDPDLGMLQENDNLHTTATLPATSTLSLFSAVNPSWDVMGTVSYTQWDVFKNVVLYDVSGINEELNSSDTITVVIPQNYKNSWNYSVGANYHVNEQWFIRMGGGYDQTPSNDEDRNLQVPDGKRIALAMGTHYQASKTLGFDVGWTHFFRSDTSINVVQVVGGQVTTTKGTVEGNADVYGFQMKWDII